MTTFDGEVTVSRDWGDQPRRWRIIPALEESHERELHEMAADAGPMFWIPTADPRLAGALAEPRLERAIGVIYRPDTERFSHYFPARLDGQFDVVLHIDRTTALAPLDSVESWNPSEPPETYPSGL
jgi:erythromycin esterase-like protein